MKNITKEQLVKELEEIQTNEEKYSLVFESISDVIFGFDKEWRYTIVNKGVENSTQMPREKLLGRKLQDVFPGIEKSGFFKTYKQVMETREPAMYNDEYTYEDGRKGCYENRVYPFEDGILITAVDITERKQAEEALSSANQQLTASEQQLKTANQQLEASRLQFKESEERLNAFMNSAPLNFGIYDSELNLIEINKAGLSMWPVGTKKEDIIGKNIAKLVPNIKKTGRYDEYLNIIKTGKSFFSDDIVPDPKFGDIHLEAIAFKVGNGFGMITSDITKRVQFEKEREKLLHDVGERVKELQCLYGTATSIRECATLEEMFREVVALIPSTWYYPNITCGRICFEGKEYVSNPFKETKWKQSSDIVVAGKRRGSVDVFYMEKRPDLDEGPFLKEERRLIDTIASTVSEGANRKLAEEALKAVNQQLKAGEQQLKATNQQLEANNQQLTASEQQLKASNQQLEASNQQLKVSEHELVIRNKIANIFLTVSDDEMFDEVLKIQLDVFQSKFGVFGYLNESGDLVVPTMTRHIWKKCQVPDKDIVFPRDKWGCSSWPRAISEKKINYSNKRSNLTPKGHIPVERHISAPIVFRDKVIGLIQMANKETDYTESDIKNAQTFVDNLAPMLNVWLHRDKYEKKQKHLLDAFKAANQQLTASEQQLKATNQQLGASNQQLTASEQQLQAANQQLKANEQVIIESEKKFHSMLVNLMEGFYSATLDGKLLFCNTEFIKILGLSPNKEYIGIDLPDFWQNQEDRKKYIEEFLKNGFIRNYVVNAKKSNGEKIILQANSLLIKDKDEKPLRIEGTFLDITKQKTTEEEIKKTNQNLRDALNKLQEMSAQLIQIEKMTAIGTMAAGLSHELYNPMMGILNFSQYCIKHTSEDDKRYSVLKDTIKETERCIDIVHNFLTFSRSEKKGEEVYQKENFNILISKVVRLLDYHFKRDNIKLKINIDNKAPDIYIQVNKIQQVILNIMNNALDAVKTSDNKKIHIDIKKEDKYIKVSISDTGCGITDENKTKIFDPFFTTKSAKENTGLGLFICMNIIKEHEGEITYESNLDIGTCFNILLPVKN